jgi:predicted kinase
MGIGIPGSGKTTLLKKFSEDYGYSYICPDDIRLKLTGDPRDQSKNKEVWDEAYNLLKQYLMEGKTVVFDATFADVRARVNCIKLARQCGVEKVQGIYINSPIEIARERNLNRERVVPEHVLERMHKNLDSVPPDLQEDFDSIFTLDEYHKLMRAKLKNEETTVIKEFKRSMK